jgi:TonB family protein
MDAILANLLGWCLQVAVVVAGAAAAAWMVRVDAASVRHAWWRTVLVMCMALPILQPWQAANPSATIVIDDSRAAHDVDPSLGHSAHRVPLLRRLIAAAPSWSAVVFVVLASGIVARLAWLAAGLVRLRRLRRIGLPEPDAFSDLVAAGADVRYVDHVGQPVTFGIRHPVVLLPSTLRALPEPVQHAVLAHELWHVRRRDWAWVVVEEALRATLWFHPAMWWLISRIQSSREEVVDELTLLVTGSRRHYLEALLAFADQPPLFAAAPFARRQHLYQRMLLLSKEAVMSSKRIVASCAGMGVVLALAGVSGVIAFPLRAATQGPLPQSGQTASPVRDPRPEAPRPPTALEEELKTTLRTPSASASEYLDLAKLQEARGALSEAEATLVAARTALPTDKSMPYALAAFYRRTGQFDRAVVVVEEMAALDPGNPAGYQVVATYYFEKVRSDQALSPVEKITYLRQGIAATDRALALQPDFLEALVYKNLLLRTHASLEPDPAKQQALLTEADVLRSRAMALQNARGFSPAGGRGSASAPPPPPPPPPPPSTDDWAASVTGNGKPPIRPGENLPAPRKIVDVEPAYPPIAQSARVQGVVVVDAVIDESGNVSAARVARSIPLLDQAALDAVTQWKFTPTLLNGAPVPVVVTMTINFTLR